MTKWSVVALAVLCSGCNVANGWSLPFSTLLFRGATRDEEAAKPKECDREQERADQDPADDNSLEEELTGLAITHLVLPVLWMATTIPLCIAADVVLLPVTVPHDLLQPRLEPVPFRPMYAPAHGPTTLEAPPTDRDAAMTSQAEVERGDWLCSHRLLIGATLLDDPSSAAASDHLYVEYGMVARPPESPWGFECGLGIGAGKEEIDPAPSQLSTTLIDFTVGGRLTGDLGWLFPYVGGGVGLSYATSDVERSPNELHDHDLLGMAYVRAGVDFAISANGLSVGFDVRHSFTTDAELLGSSANLDHTQAGIVIGLVW